MAVNQLHDGNDEGSSLGGAVTDKVSLYGVTPVVQPAAAGQAAVTNTTTTTSTTTALTTDLDNLRTLVLAMRTAMISVGVMKGAA
jgi:hypothetical protein